MDKRSIVSRTPEEFEKQTQNAEAPMKNWARVIVETDEKSPKLIAVITNDDCETADGLRVRFLPAKD